MKIKCVGEKTSEMGEWVQLKKQIKKREYVKLNKQITQEQMA